MPTHAKRIAIVGGGLGGLTAAIALRQTGFDVTVFEQTHALGEVGAGVQLSPNATRIFARLGLAAAFRAIAFEPDAHVVRSWQSGAIVSRTPMKGVYEEQYGSGYFGAHRADLHAMLASALPPEAVILGAKCTSIDDNGSIVVLGFADGTQFTADLVIGADGIHSVVRGKLFGTESPHFTGNICWRGLVPAALVPGLVEPNMTVWFGPHANVVTYYVRGGELVNWVASHESGDWLDDSWRVPAPIEQVIDAYREWHPSLRTLFAQTEECYKWALNDRPPLTRWSVGRVTMLGDAAHAMLPFLAQGACMAVEDAYALSLALAMHPDSPEAAFQVYEAERIPRTTRVQRTARERSKINNFVSPLARLRRDIGYRLRKAIRPKEHTYNIDWIYGYDAKVTMGQ